MKHFMHFWRDESGTSAIEYGFILALIVIGIVASITSIGQNFVEGPLNTVATHMNATP